MFNSFFKNIEDNHDLKQESGPKGTPLGAPKATLLGAKWDGKDGLDLVRYIKTLIFCTCSILGV